MPGAPATPPGAARSETVFHLQQAFKLALSLALFYWLALSMNWDVPRYGALAIVIVSLGTSGASIEKGILRVVGTTVGVAVGFLILSLFNDDRWATMLAFAAYITGIGYFMQASRYSYAWYVAAFVPLVVWADNYPNFDSAFYFGTFRYLNTTVGVLIYTMVDLVFWPRHAGEQLNRLGRDLWAEVREQFRDYRGQLEQGQLPQKVSDRRTRMAGTFSATVSTLQDAYFDTPNVRAQKRVWEAWRTSARAMIDALELWRESIEDCRELDLDRLLPGLGPGLETLDKRLERISILWESRLTDDRPADTDDSSLVTTLSLDLERSACAELSHGQRAAFMNFLGQLRILDLASRDLLRTMRVLAGMEPSRRFRVSLPDANLLQPTRWDPQRLIHALFPPAAFIAAFFFWVFLYPPPGPAVPMFAGVLSLVILRTPMNPLPLFAVFVLSIFLAVAPIYWLVMPALSSGFGILSLIFIYSFVFGYLGGRSPALKLGPMVLFVILTGINNQQRYSFQGPVDGALMILLSGTIVSVVFFMFTPMRPEQALLRSLRRFFHGCARVTREFAQALSAQPGRRQRVGRQYLGSLVLPALANMKTAQEHLDYKLYPANSPENVQRLYDSLQSVAYRLESLEITQRRIASQSTQVPKSFARLGRQVCETQQRVFERWAGLDPDDEFEKQRVLLQQLSQKIQQQLDDLTSDRDRDQVSDQVLTDLCTMLGSLRGLNEAVRNAQRAMNQINWPQWATARF
jgi:uncharacterized membrane protein YccC